MNQIRYYTPQEAEAAFYAAFIKRDVNAMMAVWAEDDGITCIHPIGTILKGREAIRESWESMFRNAPEMQIVINERSRSQNHGLAIHTVEEHIRVSNKPPSAPVHATNVYRLTETGWRLVLHHASPSPPPAKADMPTLH